MKKWAIWFLGLGVIFVSSSAVAGSCEFKFKGKLEVENRLNGELEPIRGAHVKLWAHDGLTWTAWDTARTGKKGRFVLQKSKSNRACTKGRFIKIAVEFKGKRFEVRHKKSTTSLDKVKWYTLFNTREWGYYGNKKVRVFPGTYDVNDRLKSSKHNLKGYAFRFQEKKGEFPKPTDLENFQAWSHATIWNTYNETLDYLKSLGPKYAFQKKFAVKYPNDNVVPNHLESSYASPATQIIYIFKSEDSKEDHFTTGTLLHELMHIWAYQHDKGSTGLIAELMCQRETHDWTDNESVAFHEGFAEYAMYQLEREVFGWDGSFIERSTSPYSRAHIYHQLGLTKLKHVDNHDLGWLSILNTLTTSQIETVDVGTSSIYPDGPIDGKFADLEAYSPESCDSESWDLEFKDVLKIFLEHDRKGLKAITKDEMVLGPFLARALKVLPNKLDATQVAHIKKVINPVETEQPYEILGCDGD